MTHEEKVKTKIMEFVNELNDLYAVYGHGKDLIIDTSFMHFILQEQSIYARFR